MWCVQNGVKRRIRPWKLSSERYCCRELGVGKVHESERAARNEIAGSVFGASFQAGAVHGDVHLHGRTVGAPEAKLASFIEHLSSDNAMTRIAGVRLVEDLGQQVPEFRQPVMDVLCAYLRPAGDHTPGGGERRVLAIVQQVILKHMSLWQNDVERVLYDLARGTVRTADSREKYYWPNIVVDFSGATLTNFDASGRCILGVDFSAVRFEGDVANFSHSYFSDFPRFDGAVFVAPADFTHCYFNKGASFERVYFAAGASFRESSFTGPFKKSGLRCAAAIDMAEMRMF